MRVLAFFIFFPYILFAQRQTEREIIQKMLTACDQLKTATFILYTKERSKENEIEGGEMLVKMQRSPLRMYLNIYSPNSGVELLYREGEMNNHLLVNPNGFPFFNLKLDMNNPAVRKNSHHTVRHICFDHLTGLIRHYLGEMGEKVSEYLLPADTVVWERHTCIKIEFSYPEFGYKTYVPQSGEDAISIAGKLHVNDYMIVCANPGVSDIHDIDAGKEIRVPNMFGKKIIFLVDIKSMLPLVQEIHDDKGLYERYEYRSFVLNPAIKPEEFTQDFPAYGF